MMLYCLLGFRGIVRKEEIWIPNFPEPKTHQLVNDFRIVNDQNGCRHSSSPFLM